MEPSILEHILDGREEPNHLPFTLLKKITEHFSECRVIGQGGFATVYKGVLSNGNVAVKRIRNNHLIDDKLFYREVDSLLAISHQNIVQFLGFCASTDQTAIKVEGSRQHIYAEIRERLLCFEYISNGSLQKYITDELRGLEWNTRYQIIRGICEGLHHLHKEKHIYHMDLKPANILLDNHMVPKITDFGLSRLDEKSQTMSEDRLGSLGYCAPEYLRSGKMSFKSDIFSLGIIITQLVTGDKGIPDKNKNNVLRRWRHRWKKSGKETPLAYQQVAKCIEIGLHCQDFDPSKRPFIWDIIHDIREMENVDGTISNACEYTFGQISPYSEDDLLGVEPLELHFPFEINKPISCTLKLTNQTDAYVAFNIQNMSPLPYCMRPDKDIVPPRSNYSVDVTLHPQDKAPREMQRADEFIIWSTKVNDGFVVKDITINMFNTESGVVDAINLDVVFAVENSTKVSKELILHKITEEISKIRTDGTVGDMKKSQECLFPTPLWTSSTGSHNHQEAAKESSATQQIKSHEESPPGIQCTDKLLVLNNIASKDLADQSVPGEIMNKTDGKVTDEVISNESLSGTPSLSESSIGNPNYQDGAQAFRERQSHDAIIETKSIPMEDNHGMQGGDIYSIDANQTKPLIITGSSNGCVSMWNYKTEKSIGFIAPDEVRACSVKLIARKPWFLVGSLNGFIHVYDYKREIQRITSIRAHRNSVSNLAIHPTQSYVLSACSTEIKLWDYDHLLLGWKCMQTFDVYSIVSAVTFNPEDYNSFATASCNGGITVWSLDSPNYEYTLSGHSGRVTSLDFFTHDGQQYIITASVDMTAKIWNTQNKKCVSTLHHRSKVRSALAHPELHLLVTVSDYGEVCYWSSTNFRLKRTIVIGNLSRVTGLSCNIEPRRIVVAYRDSQVRVEVLDIVDEEELVDSEGIDENFISATD